MTARTFPKPWRSVEVAEAFAVQDARGFAIVYVYFDDIPERATIRGRVSRDEARRIAANIARLPDLLEMAKRVGMPEPQNDERPATPKGGGPAA